MRPKSAIAAELCTNPAGEARVHTEYVQIAHRFKEIALLT